MFASFTLFLVKAFFNPVVQISPGDMATLGSLCLVVTRHVAGRERPWARAWRSYFA
jgi:hypothetical protein